MTLTDPISDMITIIRNGLASKKKEVCVSNSKLKIEILKILKKEQFITDFKPEKSQNKGHLLILLKYSNNDAVISSIKRISKPGRRVYIDKNHIPNIKRGRGRMIISTSKGVITSQEARKQGVGGEVILEVW